MVHVSYKEINDVGKKYSVKDHFGLEAQEIKTLDYIYYEKYNYLCQKMWDDKTPYETGTYWKDNVNHFKLKYNKLNRKLYPNFTLLKNGKILIIL